MFIVISKRILDRDLWLLFVFVLDMVLFFFAACMIKVKKYSLTHRSFS